jgi:hypothetical protein
LVVQDSVDPQDLYNSLYDIEEEDGDLDGYSQLPERRVRLSELQKTYERQDKKRAIGRFHQRSKLQIDDDFTVPTDDPNFSFSCNKSYLDFIMIVGDVIGIDIFLPNVTADHHFALLLDLRLQIKEFKPKQGALGFDPTGAMLCVSQTAVEDFWIGFAPNAYFTGDIQPFFMTEEHGDTRLSGVHYRIGVIFVITLIAQTLPNRGFYIFNPYDVDIWNGEHDLMIQTNIL